MNKTTIRLQKYTKYLNIPNLIDFFNRKLLISIPADIIL